MTTSLDGLGRRVVRVYQNHVINREPWERTWTVWHNGKCLESGIASFVDCIEWIESRR